MFITPHRQHPGKHPALWHAMEQHCIIFLCYRFIFCLTSSGFIQILLVKAAVFGKVQQSINIWLALFAYKFKMFFHSNCTPVPHLRMRYREVLRSRNLHNMTPRLLSKTDSYHCSLQHVVRKEKISSLGRKVFNFSFIQLIC